MQAFVNTLTFFQKCSRCFTVVVATILPETILATSRAKAICVRLDEDTSAVESSYIVLFEQPEQLTKQRTAPLNEELACRTSHCDIEPLQPSVLHLLVPLMESTKSRIAYHRELEAKYGDAKESLVMFPLSRCPIRRHTTSSCSLHFIRRPEQDCKT